MRNKTVRYVGQADESGHIIEIAAVGAEFDWWCSCNLINGGRQGGDDHPTADDAEGDAVLTHERQGEPITRPQSFSEVLPAAVSANRPITDIAPQREHGGLCGQGSACGYLPSHPSHDFALPDEDRDGEFGPRRWCDGVPGDWQQPMTTAPSLTEGGADRG